MSYDARHLLKRRYSSSRALLIGIDEYSIAPRLCCAVSDAQAVGEVLVNNLGFSPDGVMCLLNEKATKEAILRAYMRFAADDADLDERLIVFFAGHGHTTTGYRGEAGYLVPVDGDIKDLASLISWNELTTGADVLRPKHVLFIMDACYGGLMLPRAPAGATRFLKDMLQRYSRQVLTAGKADETVADAGGPIPNHSVFTGHLLQGLQGEALGQDGILTANRLMAYVCGKVATDKNSRQTPHYGYFDGDGDMVLVAPQLDASDEDETKGMDTLIAVPIAEEECAPYRTDEKIRKVKGLLASSSGSIELHDFVMDQVRHLLANTSEDAFVLRGEYSLEELPHRLSSYEDATSDLARILACIAYWAQPSHAIVLRKALARSVDRLESQDGMSRAWLALRWYPAILEMYSCGIAAVHAGRYDSLASIFLTQAGPSQHERSEKYYLSAVSNAILELNRTNVFKQIPGHERYLVPMSEYLFKILQPLLDDTLFVGSNYEPTFDEFEILLALSVADLRLQAKQTPWAPMGRFGWKQASGEGLLSAVVDAASNAGEEWTPLKAGLFGGNADRVEAAAKSLFSMHSRMRWW